MATWTVTSQRYTERLQPNGQFMKVALVGVTADDGSNVELDIPVAQYTPDNVKAQAQLWYDNHAAIRALQG